MKLLSLFITLTGLLLMPRVADSSTLENQGLEMQIENDLVFQKMVKIYDYDGLLIREFPLEDVVNDKITLVDHMIMEESDFAFDHMGDYYYLGDAKDIQDIVN